MIPTINLTIPLTEAPTILLGLKAMQRYHGKGTEGHDVMQRTAAALEKEMKRMEDEKASILKSAGAIHRGSGV